MGAGNGDGHDVLSRPLDHERLDVYVAAVALAVVVVGLARHAPRGHGWLGDQAERASTVLNLAEALGREGAGRALRMARGSALDLDAALTVPPWKG